jgi:DNA-binding HxlR family transcriptional regulator
MSALNMIGGKWKVPILWQLYNADLRYNELKRRLDGITNIMLTRCLRDLEEAGLVNRVQYSEIPPHVEYSLTPYSRKLGKALLDIKDWGEQMQFIQNNETKNIIDTING